MTEETNSSGLDQKPLDQKPLVIVLVILATIIPCCLAVCAFIGIAQIGDLTPRGFGLGAPSDSTIRELALPNYPKDVFGNDLRNFDVTSKHKCETISEFSAARGVEQAWVVQYTYDYLCDDWCPSGSGWVEVEGDSTIIRRNGEWEEKGGGICP